MNKSEHIIDGRKFAANLNNQLAQSIEAANFTPKLAIILVGDNRESLIYINNKLNKAQEVGIDAQLFQCKSNTTEKEVLEVVKTANEGFDGVIVQMPLPSHINTHNVIEAIDPNKDVDGFHPVNVGRLNLWQDALQPCTPTGVMLLLKHLLPGGLTGKYAVVLGRSIIVGRPMSALLLKHDCSVTTLHSKSRNIQHICQQADIIISAMGCPGRITAEYVKEGAIVIDVGIKRVDNKIVGDVDFENVKHKAQYITPVPGGVGPITVAALLQNTYKAALICRKLTKQ